MKLVLYSNTENPAANNANKIERHLIYIENKLEEYNMLFSSFKISMSFLTTASSKLKLDRL